MSFHPEINGNELKLLLYKLANEPPEGEKDHLEYYRNISSGILNKVKEIISTFLEVYDQSQMPEKQAALLYQLVFCQLNSCWLQHEIQARLQDALNTEIPVLISIAIDGIRLLGYETLIIDVSHFMEHESAEVRSSILKFLIQFNKNGVNLDTLIDCFEASSPENDDEYYYDAAALIYKQGPDGIKYLLEHFHQVQKAVQKRAILYILTTQNIVSPSESQSPIELTHLLAQALDAREWEVVVEGIDGLKHLNREDFQDRIFKLQNHPSPYIQSAVLRYMSAVNPERALPILFKGIYSSHFIVRETAADELRELAMAASQKEEAIVHLKNLLADNHPDVRQAAQTALEFLEETFLE